MTVCIPLSVPTTPTSTTRPSRLPSIWELSAALQDDSRWVALLAERLDSDDEDERARAIADLEQTLAAEQHSREAFTRKADATCWVIGRLRSEATYHQEQSKRFGVLARSESSRADALETSLIQLLTRLSDAVEIDDPEALPADLVTTTTSRSPDKVSIKVRIKAAIRTALQRLDGDDDAAAISHAIAAAGRLEPQPGLSHHQSGRGP